MLLAALVSAWLPVACGPRDAAYDTSDFHIHGSIAPPDVAVPSNLTDGPSEFNGLYLEGSSAFSCCWIAPHANLLIRKHGAAKALVVGFRLPDLPRLRDGQRVTIVLPDAPPFRVQVGAGQQRTVRLALPSNLRATVGLVPVQIDAAVEYVPSRDTPPSHSLLAILHLRPQAPNDDTRHLGIILLYAYFE